MKVLKIIVLTILLLAPQSFWWGAFAAEKIDINSAPLEDLVKIIHIGESRAQELISLRPFSSLDDLVRINGISQARVQDIKEQGMAWVDPVLKAETEILGTSPRTYEAEPETLDLRTQSGFAQYAAAGLMAIFSGIIILLLKKKIRYNI